jgi:hypothetical protein
MKLIGILEVQLHVFWRRRNVHLYASVILLTEIPPTTNCIRVWINPNAGLVFVAMREFTAHPENRTPVAKSILICVNDYSISAHSKPNYFNESMKSLA